MTDWTKCIDGALMDFGQFLRDSDWYGRENELVNLFAHSFLRGRVGPDGPINVAQLGIEVAVKQLDEIKGKEVVRKDLVLWNKPNETVWVDRKPLNQPIAVIEFKVNDDKKCSPDIEWLTAYTRSNPGVLGYSVCGFIREHRGVSFMRFSQGVRDYQSFSPSDVLPRRVRKGKFASDNVRLVGSRAKTP